MKLSMSVRSGDASVTTRTLYAAPPVMAGGACALTGTATWCAPIATSSAAVAHRNIRNFIRPRWGEDEVTPESDYSQYGGTVNRIESPRLLDPYRFQVPDLLVSWERRRLDAVARPYRMVRAVGPSVDRRHG